MATAKQKTAKTTARKAAPADDRDDELLEDEGEELLEDEDDDEQADERRRDLAAVVAALGGEVGTDILLKIYRKDPKTNKREWVTDARPEDMPLEAAIQGEFGGGAYEVDVYTPTPGGSKSKKTTVPMPIASRREAPAGVPQAMDFQNIFKQLAESQANSIKQVAELLTLKMENMTLKAGGAQQGMGVTELLQLFQLFKELSPESKAKSLPEMLQELAALREIMPDMFGGGNGMTGWDAALKALDKLGAAVTGVNRAPAAAALPSPDAAGDEGEEISSIEGNEMFNLVLRQKLAQLCEKAAAGRNPAVYAEVVLDEVPEQYYDALLAKLGDNDDLAVATLASIHPPVAQFQPWFLELCRLIREALTLPPEGGDLTGPDAKSINAASESVIVDVPDAAKPNAAAGTGNPGNTTSHT